MMSPRKLMWIEKRSKDKSWRVLGSGQEPAEVIRKEQPVQEKNQKSGLPQNPCEGNDSRRERSAVSDSDDRWRLRIGFSKVRVQHCPWQKQCLAWASREEIRERMKWKNKWGQGFCLFFFFFLGGDVSIIYMLQSSGVGKMDDVGWRLL